MCHQASEARHHARASAAEIVDRLKSPHFCLPSSVRRPFPHPNPRVIAGFGCKSRDLDYLGNLYFFLVLVAGNFLGYPEIGFYLQSSDFFDSLTGVVEVIS